MASRATFKGESEWHGMSYLDNTELFLNRELAQLAFNARVLAQAEDALVPVLERLKFFYVLSPVIWMNFLKFAWRV